MFDRFFSNPKNITVSSIILLIIIGTMDVLSAEQVTYSVFYLIPLCFIAWFGRSDRNTLLMASACTLVSFFSEEAMQAMPMTWFASYWNASVKLTFFCIVGLGLTRIRRDNIELSEMNQKLKDALNEVKTLKGLLPICSGCKSIRDDTGYWTKLEDYISHHTDTKLTHGLCEECVKKEMEELEAFKKEQEEEKEIPAAAFSPFRITKQRPVPPPLTIGTEALATFYMDMKKPQEDQKPEDKV